MTRRLLLLMLDALLKIGAFTMIVIVSFLLICLGGGLSVVCYLVGAPDYTG